MSDHDQTWLVPLPKARPGYELGAALFTTYDRPHAEFLVEHLLPSLFTLAREIGEAPETRSLYFGELAVRLERLHGKLNVFSSPVAAGQAEDPGSDRGNAYPWLWRYVDLFQTGAAGAAVQHAKLWMLHWIQSGEDVQDDERQELLEIYVSSTNLTLSAFRDQLQAGWRGIIPLLPRASSARRSSWGVLPRFLEALGKASGTLGARRTELFSHLLGRCERPEGVEFVASIPSQLQGSADRGRFGAASLARLAPIGRGELCVKVCAPFIGEWNKSAIRAWCGEIGARPENVALSWIDSEHPWATSNDREGYWRMTATTHAAMVESGLTLHRLGHARLGPQTLFHDSHRPDDPRWSHAKLYELRRNRFRKLLLTSANLSRAAWGSGEARTRNFELGVLLEMAWPIEPDDQPFIQGQLPHTSEDQVEFREASILWAQATWDGKRVALECHSQATASGLAARVEGPGTTGLTLVALSRPNKKQGWVGEVLWTDPVNPPMRAVFTCGEFELDVPVIDCRDETAFSTTPLPEVDPKLAEILRDALLLERYGGPFVEPEDIPGLVRGAGPPTRQHEVDGADYSLAILEAARANFDVLDSWADQLKRATIVDPEEARRIIADGTRLHALFLRRTVEDASLTQRLPAQLAAEELQSRLEEHDER